MPRQRSSGGGRPSAPSRPSAPAPSRATPQQQRPMSSVPATRPQQGVAPAQQAQAPPAQASAGPGLFGQMASTAAGVAVGSSIGHAIGGFFGGGSSSAPAQEAPQTQYQQPVDSYAQPGQSMEASSYDADARYKPASGPCANDIRAFSSCMENNWGDVNACQYYLEQMKACQAAARPY